MLGRRYRLPVDEFPLRSSPAYRSLLLLAAYQQNNYPYNRLAVRIGKNVFVRATKRNKLKRFLISRLRALPPKGIDLLIIVNPRAAKAGEIELDQELRNMYARVSRAGTRV